MVADSDGSGARMLVLVLALVGAVRSHGVESDYGHHPCRRECQAGETRVCEYNFTLEYYYTLTKACFDCPFNLTHCSLPHCVALDGVDRGVLTINRMLPGPALHVCLGDELVVNVLNRLEGMEGASIHWHGILQHGSQHMDGTPFLTQCPLVHNSLFQYRFRAARGGTAYYHSHSGFQRADGLFGALVIREPLDTEPHALLYDLDLPEHTVVVHDWLKELTGFRFAHYHHGVSDNKPELALINGMGSFQEFKDANNASHYTPKATFTVTPGKRYRFRVISNGITNSPLQFSIDGHQMMVIASDGRPFQPVVVDSFVIYSGERYDFVLQADKEVASYWIRLRGIALGAVKKAHQTAILKYEGATEDPTGPTDWDSAIRAGIELNPNNHDGDDTHIPVSRLESLEPDDATSRETPDRTIYLLMDFYLKDNERYNHPDLYPNAAVRKTQRIFLPQINHISHLMPSTSLLTQPERNPRDHFCNAESMAERNCTHEFCQCTHLHELALGELVELVLIVEGTPFPASHPMHLHGHHFRVVAMGRANKTTTLEQIKAMDMAGNITRKLSRAPLKDTVVVSAGGYTIVRFIADNPGVWFFHCHVLFHNEAGMAMIFQVGRPDQFPAVPRNFPQCGDWRLSEPEAPAPPPVIIKGDNSNLAAVVSHASFSWLLILSVSVTFSRRVRELDFP